MSPTIGHPKNEGIHVFQRWSDRITRCLLRVAREWAIWAAKSFSMRSEIFSTCERGSIYLNSHDCLQHATRILKYAPSGFWLTLTPYRPTYVPLWVYRRRAYVTKHRRFHNTMFKCYQNSMLLSNMEAGGEFRCNFSWFGMLGTNIAPNPEFSARL